MRKRIHVLAIAFLSLLLLAVLAGCATMGAMEEMDEMEGMEETMGEMDKMAAMDEMSATFTVQIQVLTGSETPIAPVAWTVYSGANPLFTVNTATRIKGLEALAEDGNPSAVAEALSMLSSVKASGVADTPTGAVGPGPAAPGSSYSFSFSASNGDFLSFATMYVQSNDLFYSPAQKGLELFPGGKPISGDVTAQIYLYDAGTEVNERPGSGLNQVPRQSAANSGKDEMGTVRLISDAGDGFRYPAVDKVISVVVSAM